MSTKDVNDIVNRLATDRDFWDQYHANPDQALAGYNLTPAERASLEAIPHQNLQINGSLADFASSDQGDPRAGMVPCNADQPPDGDPRAGMVPCNADQPPDDDPRAGMVPCNASQPAGGDLEAGALPYDPREAVTPCGFGAAISPCGLGAGLSPCGDDAGVEKVIAPSDAVGVIAPSDLSELPTYPDQAEENPSSGPNRFEWRLARLLNVQSLLLPGGIALAALIVCAALGFGPARDQLEGLLNPPITSEPVRPRESTTAEPVVTDPPTDEPTRVRPVEVVPGRCDAECNPAIPSSCLAGLTCVQKAEGSTVHICWNASICAAIVTESANPEVTDPPVTEASTQAVVECGPGWLPAGGCTCCASTLVCADGTVAQFNPACIGGGTDGGAGDVCGDGVCSAAEAAVCGSCSADCGPC